MHVYGIGMEDHPWVEEYWRDVDYETMHKKRMVIVLSEQSKQGVVDAAEKLLQVGRRMKK